VQGTYRGRVRLLIPSLVAGLIVALVLAWDGPAPWLSACRVHDPAGAVLAQGTPSQTARAVASAEGPLAAALAAGPAVSCRVAAPAVTATPKERPLGLTPRAVALRAQVRAQFGAVPDGGFGPQPVLPGRRAGGEHSQGRAVDFFFRPHGDPRSAQAGWRLANWAVANAERLGVRTVIYRDRIWTARRSAQGWREYRFPGRDAGDPVNRHLDHVHVDVA